MKLPPRDWSPFVTLPIGEREYPRSLKTREGIGDRLRAVAAAEMQAREAFLCAAENFPDADPALRETWRELAAEENLHCEWLKNRLTQLGFGYSDRPVSLDLWVSFEQCTSAREFAEFMASAEERGRQAGLRFLKELDRTDPETAAVFRRICEDEKRHVELAARFYPELAQIIRN